MKIKIVGESGSHDYESVAGNVVKIGPRYYRRSSNDIVNVKGRYYRKVSPLITRVNGHYYLRSSIVTLTDGSRASKDSETIVKLYNGKYSRKENAVHMHDGTWYPSNSKAIVKLKAVASRPSYWAMKKDAVELDRETYGNGLFILKSEVGGADVHEMSKGRYVLKRDCFEVVRPDGQHGWVPKGLMRERDLVEILDSFNLPIDVFNPRKLKALSSDRDGFVYCEEAGMLVLPDHLEIVQDEFRKQFDNPKIKEHLQRIKSKMNNNYDDEGDDENGAKFMNFNYSGTSGGKIYYKLQDNKIVISPTKLATGGIGYTWGIEFETSAGILSDFECEKLGLSRVGDASIGSSEYTTAPHHGDLGIKKLKNQLSILSKRTMVDGRCGIHIHIGGGKDENNKKSDYPIFNRMFSVMALKLGVQIQDELFAMNPPSRRATHHCQSIPASFNPRIKTKKSLSSSKHKVGEYVFGEKLSRRHNKKTRTSRWDGHRYRWLNLVNCNSNNSDHPSRQGGFQTIEIRLWSGSTNFKKVYNFLLISLAFVWFVENRRSKILKGGVTLNQVVIEALPKGIREGVLEFIEKRTGKFAKATKKRINRDRETVTEPSPTRATRISRLEETPVTFGWAESDRPSPSDENF